MDREKVINELVEHIESALSVDSDYVDCVRTDLLQYTVALLKEQENDIGRITNEYLNLVKVASKKPEIVRCLDCKHGRQYATNAIDCEYRELATEPDWFCADGERKEVMRDDSTIF